MSWARWWIVLLLLAACGCSRSTAPANGPALREAQCSLDVPRLVRVGSPYYDTPCSQQRLAQAHRKAKAMLASGDASGALTYLSNIDTELKCRVDTGRETANPAAYELALLQLRAQLATKRCAECNYLFAYLNRPYVGGLQEQSADEHDELERIRLRDVEAKLGAVAAECGRRYDRSVADFTSVPCTLRGVKGITVPRGSVPAGATAACLELAEAPTRSAATIEEGLPCMRLLLHLDSPTGRRTIRLRTAGGRANTAEDDDGHSSHFALEEPSSCCNEFSLSTARRAGKNVLRVSGPEADCYGGTGRSEVDDYYYWTEHGLSEWVRKGVGIH